MSDTTHQRNRFRPAGTPGHLALAFIACCAAALLPWILYLTLTLPADYQARHWRFTWVGFDCALAALMAATAVTGFQRRRIAVPLAFMTGVLLGCDAWFDVCTAASDDVRASVVCAGLTELPIALLLLRASLRLMGTWSPRPASGDTPTLQDWMQRVPF